MIDGKWRSMQRIPMKKGSEIKIDGTDIVIVTDSEEKEVSSGSSCLVYQGHIKEGTGMVEGNKVIIKEFYPFSEESFFQINRSQEGSLEVAESTRKMARYQKYLKQFKCGIEYQKQLASSEAMEIAIKPLINGSWGDSIYIISDLHQGKDLKKDHPKTLKEKIDVAISLAETMDIVHDSGYLMMDMKPENFLWIRRPNMVRIVDTDSLIRYSDKGGEMNAIYLNHKYVSPEMRVLEKMVEEEELGSFSRKARQYLSPLSDLYVIGLFLYDLFWNHMPQFQDVSQMDEEKELEEFVKIYGSKNDIQDLGKKLLGVIGRLIIEKKGRRRKYGFRDAEDLMEELNEILLLQKYVPRKEISRANAVFAAYNMLEKHPLYHYAKAEKNGHLPLNVVIVGNHVMREEMLSSILSIGQMLNASLRIKMVAEDIQEFWEKYTGKEKNEALKGALCWSFDGQVIQSQVDTDLVSRPLAEIQMISHMKDFRLEEDDNYYIYLLEETFENQKVLKKYLTEHQEFADRIMRRQFVSFVGKETILDTKKSRYLDLYSISVEQFTEHYNERIFSERIYKMGLMVHAYYNGFMEKDSGKVKLDSLSKQFSKNLYDVASSERCALHSIYKMKSIGIDREELGKFMKYYGKIHDPEILEQLAWLEHISWTAYMLTNGARPVKDLSQLETYAYQEGNDWKDRRDCKHIFHPMLVSSRPECSKLPVNWMEACQEVNLEELDCLDRLSFSLFAWYQSHREDFAKCWDQKMKEIQRYSQEDFQVGLGKLDNLAKVLMAGMMKGKDSLSQKKSDWLTAYKQLEKYVVSLSDKVEQEELLSQLAELKGSMKPVLDFYSNRDFKQIDRDIVLAVMDIISV